MQEVSTPKKTQTLANPDLFMIEGGYTTSSNIINEIIDEYGLDTFVVRKLRVFKTKGETRDYETRFLQKVNARNHPRFYNGHNNDGYYSEDYKKERMLEKYGVDNYSKSPEFPNKFKETCREKYGVDHHLQNPEILEKMKETNRRVLGVDFGFQDKIIKGKIRNTKQEKYDNPTYVNPEKATQTNMER